jgi:DNA-binding CsgD family transcriptional regulator
MSLFRKNHTGIIIKISKVLFFFLIVSLILINLYDISYHLIQEGSLNLHQKTEAIILFFITILVILIKTYHIYGLNHLQSELDKKNQEIDVYKKKYKDSIQEIKQGIKEQFQFWNLTKEEEKVAQYLILGYSFKQISGLLNKSEKTIRNQSLSIYKKSGMTGRNDLAGFFLYDFFDEE